MGQHMTKNDIDTLAAFYILKMDFKSLERMADEKYCKSIQKVLVQVIDTHFKGTDLFELERRIKEGNINSAFSLDTLEIKNNKEVCKEVATFFLQIGNVYSALVSILNPVFVKDREKNESIPWFMKKTKSTNEFVSANGICESILNSFAENSELFESLYFDSWDNNSFSKMSDKAKLEYQNDLQQFYYGFSGSEDLPAQIKKFSDFHLLNTFSFYADEKNNLNLPSFISLYGYKIKETTNKVIQKQNELLDILNELFIKEIDNDDINYIVKIHPTLTANKLQDILHRTRKIILELYALCTNNNEELTNVYDSFVQERTRKTLENQISNLIQKQRELI